jgi:predicted nucleic acid-binding Zn ribbon protein
MSALESGSPTRYSVRRERNQRRSRRVLWALIGAACAVIAVFVVLILIGGGM